MGSGVSMEVSVTMRRLVGYLKNPFITKEDRQQALERLCELGFNDSEAYKVGLASDELGLLKVLASLLAKALEPGGDAQAILLASRICWSLSGIDEVKLNLVSPTNNLLPPLVRIAGAGMGEVQLFCSAPDLRNSTLIPPHFLSFSRPPHFHLTPPHFIFLPHLHFILTSSSVASHFLLTSSPLPPHVLPTSSSVHPHFHSSSLHHPHLIIILTSSSSSPHHPHLINTHHSSLITHLPITHTLTIG
jgi:hypothetical protein